MLQMHGSWLFLLTSAAEDFSLGLTETSLKCRTSALKVREGGFGTDNLLSVVVLSMMKPFRTMIITSVNFALMK